MCSTYVEQVSLTPCTKIARWRISGGNFGMWLRQRHFVMLRFVQWWKIGPARFAFIPPNPKIVKTYHFPLSVSNRWVCFQQMGNILFNFKNLRTVAVQNSINIMARSGLILHLPWVVIFWNMWKIGEYYFSSMLWHKAHNLWVLSPWSFRLFASSFSK